MFISLVLRMSTPMQFATVYKFAMADPSQRDLVQIIK